MTAPEHEDTNEVTLSADAEQTLAAAVVAHGEPTPLGAKGSKTSAAVHSLKTGVHAVAHPP